MTYAYTQGGRRVFLTGKVAIGLRYEPQAQRQGQDADADPAGAAVVAGDAEGQAVGQAVVVGHGGCRVASVALDQGDAVNEDIMSALNYEATTGAFVWARSSRRVKAGASAGATRRDGYVQIHACGRLWMAHRLAWLFSHGKLPDGDIDHIDGNPSNNAIANLRDVPRLLNMQNQRKAHCSNKSSGLLGVSFDTKNKCWIAKISVNCRTKNLGRFVSPEAAHAAYIAAKRIYHPGSTL